MIQIKHFSHFAFLIVIALTACQQNEEELVGKIAFDKQASCNLMALLTSCLITGVDIAPSAMRDGSEASCFVGMEYLEKLEDMSEKHKKDLELKFVKAITDNNLVKEDHTKQRNRVVHCLNNSSSVENCGIGYVDKVVSRGQSYCP